MSREYTEEFKVEAVNLCEKNGHKVKATAGRLGISASTLRQWYLRRMKKPDRNTAQSETQEERLALLEKENRELRRQVLGLEEDRAILKKAAAFFAKESG